MRIIHNLSFAKKLIKECQETLHPYLDLSNCNIDDLQLIPEIFNCVHLETLIFSSFWVDPNNGQFVASPQVGEPNKFGEIPKEISKLKRLKKLIINGNNHENGINGLNNLGTLKSIVTLDISSNDISDINFLSNLTELRYLIANSNRITDLKPLTKLEKLIYLNMSNNKIRDIETLASITNIESLYLYQNKISDIKFLSNLLGLENLDLQSNRIDDINHLSQLVHLQSLNICNNNIEDISSLIHLKKIRYLNASSNRIRNIPSFIFKLDLHVDLIKLNRNSEIILNNNPIESPTLEIIEQGKLSIFDWYEANKKKLNEAKVILIGDPKAGKTSLLRRLKYDSFNEYEAQTDGVNIEDIEFGRSDTFKHLNTLHEMTGHFWDFGGQDIMNATHQFFLTRRSVYILVVDARKDDNISNQVRQWVKRIINTGGNSSIIVLANQIDINYGFGFNNEYELQNEFPQIKYFIKVSCKTNENINLLKEILAKLIPQSELFNTSIDERWLDLKDKLKKETRDKHFLDEKRFIEICKSVKLRDKISQTNAITFLHDLGTILHFKEVILSEYYVLDPYWITYGVYQILTSSYVAKQKGIIDSNKLEFIINEEKEKRKTYRPNNFKRLYYSNNQRRFLIDILCLFKLCFSYSDASNYIVPDLLDTDEPISVTESIRKSSKAIHFVYQFDYLPKFLIPRLMVENHKILVKMWRTGVILKYHHCEALISSYQSRISIVVIGQHKQKREFMSIIRYSINQITKDLIDNPQMLIPLPGTDEYVDYEVLLKRERRGKKYYELSVPIEKDFEISKLLEGIPSQDEIQLLHKKIDEIRSAQNKILNILNSHYEYLINRPENTLLKDDIAQAIKEINAYKYAEIVDEIMRYIASAFELHQSDFDNRLEEIYSDLKKTNDLPMKLKLSIPLLNLVGINFETEFDFKNWINQMYEKYEINLFRIMGYL